MNKRVSILIKSVLIGSLSFSSIAWSQSRCSDHYTGLINQNLQTIEQMNKEAKHLRDLAAPFGTACNLEMVGSLLSTLVVGGAAIALAAVPMIGATGLVTVGTGLAAGAFTTPAAGVLGYSAMKQPQAEKVNCAKAADLIKRANEIRFVQNVYVQKLAEVTALKNIFTEATTSQSENLEIQSLRSRILNKYFLAANELDQNELKNLLYKADATGAMCHSSYEVSLAALESQITKWALRKNSSLDLNIQEMVLLQVNKDEAEVLSLFESLDKRISMLNSLASNGAILVNTFDKIIQMPSRTSEERLERHFALTDTLSKQKGFSELLKEELSLSRLNTMRNNLLAKLTIIQNTKKKLVK